MPRKTIDSYLNNIHNSDGLKFLRILPSQSVDCIIKQPPYSGLRNYNTKSQIWNESGKCNHKWNKKTGY